jgi:putative ABC transport system permease protein
MDLRSALRSLRHTPTFTATAILTLAIGIGGTTAMFSVVDAVLLRPLPFRDPARLVRIWESNLTEGKAQGEVSPATFMACQDRSHSFDQLALFYSGAELTLFGTPDGIMQVREASVTPKFFSLLGVSPAIGREFDGSGRAASGLGDVVLSHALWRQSFGSDPAILGKVVRIEGRPAAVVVGVMPAGFAFSSNTDLWAVDDVAVVGMAGRDARFYGAIGRLKPSVSLETAQADLDSIAGELAREYPSTHNGWGVAIAPLHESVVGSSRLAVVTLFAAAAFVLLVGCANVTNLLLARGVARRRELAVRTALGASRGRIARLLFAEALVLAIGGGAAGWLLAEAMLPVLVRLATAVVPRLVEARLSWVALAYCGVASIITTVFVGLVPAAHGSRTDVQSGLQADGERATTRAGHSGLQRLLVATEIGVSLVLIVGALLLIESFVQLRRVELGFNPDHVLTLDLRVPIFAFSSTPDVQSRYLLSHEARDVLARLRSLPGVESAATTNAPPLSGNATPAVVTLAQGYTRTVLYHRVSDGYFRTMGGRLIEGRDFGERDAIAEAQFSDLRASRGDGAMLVSQTAARALWPNGRAIGQYVTTSLDWAVKRRRVIGVVADARSESLRAAPAADVYVPYLEDPSFAMTVVVRTPLPPDRIVPALRGAFRAVDPNLSVAHIRMLDEIVDDSVGSARFSTIVVAVFAALGLLLSAVGTYGVLAFGVTRRTREIGIRMALGAAPGDITRLFLCQATEAIGAGVVVGVAGAIALGRLISGLLFGVAAADPVSFVASVLLLVAVALTASYLPLRRAARIDPADALRR